MSNTELNNCPCCGGQAKAYRKLRTYFNQYAVICTECGIRTDDYPTMETAIEKWNTRKSMDRIVEQMEEQETKVEKMSEQELLIEKMKFISDKLKNDTALDVDILEISERWANDIDIVIKELEEIQKYRALGTVEELQEAREKQKKEQSHIDVANGKAHKCPICHNYMVDDFGYATNYCKECNQRIGLERGIT